MPVIGLDDDCAIDQMGPGTDQHVASIDRDLEGLGGVGISIAGSAVILRVEGVDQLGRNE
jgi:hypothetical protein